MEEYLGLYGVSASSLFPQLGGTASGQEQKSSIEAMGPSPAGAAVNPITTNIQATLNVSWEIDVWGRLRRATEAARADLFSREENRRAVVLTLVTSVARSYVQLRELDLRLDIARQTLADRREAYRIAQARFAGELNSESEVRQAESELRNAEALVPQLEKSVAQKEHELSVLLGHNPAAVERGLALNELRHPEVPMGLPSELLQQRPDIRQAEQDLIAANARIGVAKGEYFPKFTITGSVGNSSIDLSRLFAGPAGLWSYGATLAVPLFTAGKIAGQVQQANAKEQQALFGYQRVLLNAFKEVEDALVDNSRTRQQVTAQAGQVDALREYLRLARLRYDNGYTNYLEVLDAQRNLFNVQLALAQGRSSALQALINLYKAFGGGWVEQATAAATPEAS
ncbi:efflux transporter outer membrane subunit [Methylogaea oryzae]|uniref:efflux transporter outer membrane subunit n=1 Tax=Methylogaea oryzae TaxID=1295382 RepID=UPI000AA0FFFA|nr:efflux transporter outer membrane subunit [Methylogaea oryzae]